MGSFPCNRKNHPANSLITQNILLPFFTASFSFIRNSLRGTSIQRNGKTQPFSFYRMIRQQPYFHLDRIRFPCSKFKSQFFLFLHRYRLSFIAQPFTNNRCPFNTISAIPCINCLRFSSSPDDSAFLSTRLKTRSLRGWKSIIRFHFVVL